MKEENLMITKKIKLIYLIDLTNYECMYLKTICVHENYFKRILTINYF